MPLEPINPFSYLVYRNHIDFVTHVVEYVENNEIKGYTGWTKQLLSYTYNSSDGVVHFQEGINARYNFHNQLVEAIAQGAQQLQPIVNEIMTWGGMQPFPVTNELLQSFHILDALAMGNHTNWQNLIGRRIASTSKIYEMYNPHNWSIYDSRVGRGIQFLVAEFGADGNHDYLGFQMPPGRNRNPINGFSIIHSPRQAILGFIYASWLSRAIAENLNNTNIPLPAPLQCGWSVYHIEMVFFMIGR